VGETVVTVTQKGGTVVEVGEVIARLRCRESLAGGLAEGAEARELWDLELSTTGAISTFFVGGCTPFRSGGCEVGSSVVRVGVGVAET
jgi:hypothetical protein